MFAQPLTVMACGVQNKYVFYKSCSKCPKRLINHVCAEHGYQREHVYRFALRLLLSDSIGSECWCTCFDAKAVKILGFTANDYNQMETDEQRHESMSTLRGSRVMVVIRKRVTKEYVNYTVDTQRGDEGEHRGTFQQDVEESHVALLHESSDVALH